MDARVVRAGFVALIVSIVWATAASASSVDGKSLD